jgi:hypothetical protein
MQPTASGDAVLGIPYASLVPNRQRSLRARADSWPYVPTLAPQPNACKPVDVFPEVKLGGRVRASAARR